MRLLAPAKVNLFLRVGPRREDGFHPLLSWMCTVGLFDTLTLGHAGCKGIALNCDQAGLATDQGNLVCKAAAVLSEELVKNASVDAAGIGGICATLQKRIPVGAGLGGGSSDAARMLLGLNRLWNAGWSVERLAELSARLGSDLPFFFFGPSSICTGRGERVRPVPAPALAWVVLVLPPIHMPTPAVYRRFDEMGLGTSLNEDDDFSQWATLGATELLARLVNDLEMPAFSICPELGKLRGNIEQSLSRIVRMSGSGSSLFTLFDIEEQAVEAASIVSVRHGVPAMAIRVAPSLEDDLAAGEA